jgi:PAS domain S-box-containing protein
MIVRWKPDGTRTFVNKAYCRTFGKTFDELVGTSFWPLVAEPYRERVHERIRNLTPDSPYSTGVHESLLSDGTTRWQEWTDRGFFDDQGRLVELQSVGRDITERRRVEEALRESEAKLKQAQQLAQIGYWEHDLIADRITGSEEASRIFGLRPEENVLSHARLQEMIHPDDRQIQQQALTEALQGNRLYDAEYRIVRPDGDIRFVHARDEIEYDEAGRPIRMFGEVQDITERKQAEAAIQRHAARMEMLADISHTFQKAGLDYQSVLDTVARRTAESIGDASVMSLFSDDGQRSYPVAFYHRDPKALAVLQDAILQTWQGGTDTRRFPRYEALLSGKSVFIPEANPEEFRASLGPELQDLFDAVGVSSYIFVPLKVQGQVIGALGLIRGRHSAAYTRDDQVLLQDLADRAALIIQNAQLFKQVEGARERLKSLSRRLLEVQEAERRALTSELHDRVGQNLTGLSINLQNMKALLSDENAKTLAAKFDDAQALVEDTTRQIRDIMAGLHLPELEEYGLAAALEIYAERAASRGNLELIADLPDLAHPLSSDVRIGLFRAAQEAISNVLKHANATQMKVSLEGQNGRVCLQIEDNGQGFEPDSVSQKGVQTWGLQIMRERIESIGGIVQIESKPGQGTRVIFEVERQS